MLGLGAAEEKDNELAIVGNGDEIMVSKRAISFHSDIVMYSPFSTSGQLPAGAFEKLSPEHFSRPPVELLLPGQYEAAAE